MENYQFFTLITLIVGGFGWTFRTLADRMDKLEARIDKLDEKITDIDRRLCRLEGAFSSKEFCVLKNSSREKVE